MGKKTDHCPMCGQFIGGSVSHRCLKSFGAGAQVGGPTIPEYRVYDPAGGRMNVDERVARANDALANAARDKDGKFTVNESAIPSWPNVNPPTPRTWKDAVAEAKELATGEWDAYEDAKDAVMEKRLDTPENVYGYVRETEDGVQAYITVTNNYGGDEGYVREDVDGRRFDSLKEGRDWVDAWENQAKEEAEKYRQEAYKREQTDYSKPPF